MSYKVVLVFVAACVLGAAGWVARHYFSEPSTTLILEFKPTHDGDVFQFGKQIYDNPGGAGKYGFRDFRFYASNLVLEAGDGTFAVPDSYYLVRFDASTPTHSIVLSEIPLAGISTVTFSIGLDEEANGSIETRGDVDPNSRMAWNWTIGYKFLLAEGDLQVSGQTEPLVYHVGFNENRRETSFNVSSSGNSDEVTVSFDVDISTLFDGKSKIDMATLSTVKMHRPDAALLAENYAEMVVLSP